ncbi:MAG: hypothetical protein DIZ80_00440 [endosymbiont of Galathealinum brachiosum]|uniref:Lipoprotein n=1 Tax=endosymbiont of Galathealinum brachiosum TaxID=2200906 RepID=A0A370DPB0_9GAMM|nr:MAG: hypothetical protein DIZ80_00440 [endosymbiont of Galathealinum brachiosum]
MKNNSFLKKIFIFLALIAVSGCANSDIPSLQTDKSISNIDKSIRQGKIVIVYQIKNTDKTSEQYADWSAYLNDFTDNKANIYVVHNTSKAFNKKLSSLNINIDGNYSVFIKQGKATYYYDSVILEPMIYIAIDNAFSGKQLSPTDKAFLPEAIKLKY